MTARILVVIVNYRTPDLTIAALAAIAPEIIARGDTQVVIVDNGSGDGSAERIAEAIAAGGADGWCRLHAPARNHGFAAGNNEGIAFARTAGIASDLIWLLNPDTIAQHGALTALADFVDAHPAVGIVGGQTLASDGTPRISAFHFPSPIGELLAALRFGPLTRRLLRHDVAIPIAAEPIRADWVEGSHMLLRQAVLDRVGPMDEAYFLYFEEVDLCARAAAAGFECWHIPASRVVHLAGQATGVTGQTSGTGRRPPYWFDSRARFLHSRHGSAGLLLANLLWLTAWPIGSLWARLRGRPLASQPGLWRDMLRYGWGKSK
jgi:N-acetylglucosaminyl-diphospho-decaprenol L-rhamnosyltransferase